MLNHKNIFASLLLFLVLSNHSAFTQSWLPPDTIINPNSGNGAITGFWANLVKMPNGYPAMADPARGDLRFLRAGNVSGSGTWPIQISVDTGSDRPQYTSLAIVNGMPAISYYDQTYGDLKYVRATNADGTQWADPVRVDWIDNVGQFTSLVDFNGKPAISYYDVTNGDLKYVIATNPEGSNWSPPITVDAANNVGQYTSMKVANSIPTIAYYDVTNGDLKYATIVNGIPSTGIVDATGNAGKYASLNVVNNVVAISYYNDLTTPFGGRKGYLQYISIGGSIKILDGFNASGAAADVGQYTSLQIINGNPAISYYDNINGDLKYIRCNDAQGNIWDPSKIKIVDPIGTTGLYTSLCEVNGSPSIAYQDQTNFDLKLVNASDPLGSSWLVPTKFDASGPAGDFISVKTISGYPAVVYYNGTYDYSPGRLMYVRATNTSGTEWGEPQTLDLSGGRAVSFQIINGNPAVSYAGSAGLRYIRASDPEGVNWGSYIPVDATAYPQSTSLCVVNGKPAIAYSSYAFPDNKLKYVQAINAEGTQWETQPFSFPYNFSVDAPSLQEVNGKPAISFFDATNGALGYVQRNALGNTWGSAINPIPQVPGN